MKLSKQRLLQIIREEITAISEQSPTLDDLQNQRTKDALATSRRGKENLASRGLDFGVQGGPDVEGTITPWEMKNVVGASTAGDKAWEKEEDTALTQRLASLRKDENALERMVREEMEEYLSEEDNLAEGWLDGFLRDWKPGKSTGPPKRPGGPLNPNEVEPTGTGSRQERGARNVFDKDSVTEADNSFSKAGEEIEKKGTEGVFTAKADKAGMGVQAYADKVLAKDSKASTKTKRQAAFAKGAATVAKDRKKNPGKY